MQLLQLRVPFPPGVGGSVHSEHNDGLKCQPVALVSAAIKCVLFTTWRAQCTSFAWQRFSRKYRLYSQSW